MTVIFLDIDGVLATLRQAKRMHIKYVKTGEKTVYDKIDPISLKNLFFLIEELEAKVIISSSWRNTSMNDLIEILEKFGIGKYVIGETPTIDTCVKGLEIQQCLDSFKEKGDTIIDTFLILDDEEKGMSHLLPYLIKVDDYTGITSQTVKEAFELIEKQKSGEFDRLSQRIENRIEETNKIKQYKTL